MYSKRFEHMLTLLIVPYGIETFVDTAVGTYAIPFNCTLWN